MYNAHEEIIKMENNKEANEKLLFHGTSSEGAEGVCLSNFDNRYFRDGKWGYGAYFADDPVKSNDYAVPNGQQIKSMLINKVLLG